MVKLTILDFLTIIPKPTWMIVREHKSELIDHIQLHNCGRSINFKEDGWYYERGNTFLLVQESIYPVFNDVWRMYFWKDFDPRPMFEGTSEV